VLLPSESGKASQEFLFFSFPFLCVTQGLSWALTAYINWANYSSLSQLLQGAYRSCAGVCVFFSLLGDVVILNDPS